MIDFQSNFQNFGQKLPEQFFKDVSFATTRSIDRAVMAGVKSGEELAFKELQTNGLNKTGGPMVGGLDKRGRNKGLVRGWSPKRAQVAVNLRKGFANSGSQYSEARVFIVNDADPAKRGRSFDLVDEMHGLVFGGTEKDTNIIPGIGNQRGIITPTTALMEGLEGRGRLKQLNKFGNLAGLKNHLSTLLRSKDSLGEIFLNVPLNNTNPRLAHLRPGLYFRGREISRGGTLRDGDYTSKNTLYRQLGGGYRYGRTRTKGSIRIGGAKDKLNRIRRYLVMLIAYHDSREVDAQFPFDDVVARDMKKVLVSNQVFFEELGSAFASSLAGGRYGTRKFL